MARLKLPKPVRINYPPDRTYLHDPKVDLTKEELKSHNEGVFIVTESGEYELSASIDPVSIEPKIVDEDHANLISSKCSNGKHAPVIDVDIPIYVVPSSQLGHHHLYIDKEISWASYVRLLKALENAGIIEPGYLKVSLEREYTAVRPIGVTKPGSPRGSNVLKENSILRKRVRDLVIEVEHLHKELANGIPDEVIVEIERLRAQNKERNQLLSETLSAYDQAKLELEKTQDKLNTLRLEQENNKVSANPQVYNATWS